MKLASVFNVIKSALFEYGDTEMSHYLKAEKHALDCLRDFQYDTRYFLITKVFTISAVATLDWDTIAGYSNWCKVGTLVGDRIKIFTLNDRLTSYRELVNNVEQLPAKYTDTTGDSRYEFTNYVGNGGAFADAVYGYGNGSEHNQGQFNVDSENKRFIFDQSWANKEIILEYITNGINANAESFIPDACFSMFKQYIIWKLLLRNKNTNISERIEAESMYEWEKTKAMRRIVNVTYEDVVAVWWNAHYSAPKT